MHVFPQVLKLDTGHRIDFIGSVSSRLERDFETLFRDYLGLDSSALLQTLSSCLNRPQNVAQENTDRCGVPILFPEAEREALRPAICALMEADYQCFGDHFGQCV